MRHLILLCLLLCANAFAVEPPKSDTTGAAGKCRPVRLSEDVKLRWTTLYVHNNGPGTVDMICTPTIDTSPAGTVAFGAVLHNTTGLTVTVVCTATINTAGQGPRLITRHLMVSPGKHHRFGWYASELNTRTLVGGQGGFLCALPPGFSLQGVWTQGQAN